MIFGEERKERTRGMVRVGCREGREKKKKNRKKNSRKSVTRSAVPDAPMLVYVGM